MLPTRKVLAHLRNSACGARCLHATARTPMQQQHRVPFRHEHSLQLSSAALAAPFGKRAVAMQAAGCQPGASAIEGDAQSVSSERQKAGNVGEESAALDFIAVRGGLKERLLMVTLPIDLSSETGTIPMLKRGSVLSHENVQWVCVFSLDQYWLAVPLGEESSAEAVVHCLKQATPTQAQRAQLCDGVSTGISALDVLAPIGRGQSLLICGEEGSGKSTLACDVIEQMLSLKLFDKVVRFCADANLAPLDDDLQQRGVYTELRVSPSNKADPASSFLGSFVNAVAVAEATRDAGEHAVLIVDTLAPVTDAWEQGVQWAEAENGKSLCPESVSGQRRSFFANMFERAANLARGGSLTLLTLVGTDAFAAVNTSALDRTVSELTAGTAAGDGAFKLADFAGRKVSELERIKRLEDRGVALTEKTLAAIGIALPAQTTKTAQAKHSVVMRELQSLSDGQVVLDLEMAKANAFPAVVPGTTFSRFGLGSTDVKPGAQSVQRDVRPTALQAVAAHLRMALALEHEARFRPAVAGGASTNAIEANDADIAQSTRMEAVKAALLQPQHTHLQTEEMVALLLSACSGAFDELPPSKAVEVLRGGASAPFLKHLHSSPLGAQVLEKLKASPHISQEVARELDMLTRLFVALQVAS